MVAAEIRLDLNGKKGPDIWARLGESDTRQIVMHPGYYDQEGNWTPLIIDAENIFAKFRIVKPDNTFVIQDASLYLPSDPSIFVVTLPETATQVAGLGYYDLRIGDGETPDTFLYSAGGRFVVDDDMITDEMIASVASVNGLIFPDDFLTSADLEDYVTEEELEDYATKTYVDDAIAAIPDPLDNYSTAERVVGTWLDGVTPVYEKTYYVASPAKNADTKISDATMQDISMCLLVAGTYKRISGGGTMTYALNGREGSYSNEDSFIRVDMPDSGNYGLTYYLKTDNNVSDLIVTIRYTKTA